MERSVIKKLMATDRSDKKFMPDDHSKLVPLLPIPNRTVKRLCADDSADPRVKVGHRQALTARQTPSIRWAFCFGETVSKPKSRCVRVGSGAAPHLLLTNSPVRSAAPARISSSTIQVTHLSNAISEKCVSAMARK